MPGASIDSAQQAAARVVGGSYLVAMATAVFGEAYVRGRLIVPAEAIETAANIQSHALLWRIGMAANTLTLLVDVALIAALYVVLSPVDRHLALFATLMRTVETAIGAFALLSSFDVLRLLGDAPYVATLPAGLAPALARLAVNAYGTTTNFMFIFLGAGSTAFAHLWWKSGFVPRWLALVGLAGSAMIGLGSLAIVVAPGLADPLGAWYMLPLAFFEIAMGFLLLVKPLRRGAART